MKNELKRVLIGKPLKNEAINEEKLGVLWGLPILSSDAISSVAYAGQGMLLVLLPAIGVLAYGKLTLLSFVIIGLLFLLTISYRQTIESYPNGGGAFIVAKDNLGVISGVTAGAALMVGYILTVAVSVSSGVEQVTSAFFALEPYNIPISVAVVLLLMLGNLRGIRESSRIFGLPAYAFIVAILSMIVIGFVKIKGGYIPPQPSIQSIGQPITMILLLTAFSNGCAALTGIEAVSNAVPNFKEPSPRYARRVLVILSFIILVLFGGTSLLANMYPVVPGDRALLVLIAQEVFGRGFMFYYITATTFIILIMGANTAYSGFPMLIAVMAKEGYVPRQLCMRGDRLSYSNGIVLLSIVAIVLIVAFKAKVTSLLGLYAIGVFISFTLSQTGMLARWFKKRNKNWPLKAAVNGVGALATALVVIIIAVTKFRDGAWIVVLLIPVMIYLMLKVKRHYLAVKMQLRIAPEDLPAIDIRHNTYKNQVIVPIESINKSSIRALRYAKTISDHVTAFCIVTEVENAKEIRERYNKMTTDIPLIIRYSPFRKIVEPLLEFIESAEYEYKKGDMITVIVPEFFVRRRWHKLLHNRTRYYIEKQLLKHKHIVVAVMPLQLKDDDLVEKEYGRIK